VISGRCLCGNVTYRCDAEPALTGMCHCDDCQRGSGAPFSVWLALPADKLEIEGDGVASHVTVGTETKAKRERKFCSSCGSPVVTLMEDMPQFALVRAGTLDDRSGVEPQLEIWCDSAQPWVETMTRPQAFPTGLPAQA
jgi:hypothetical protein